MEFFLLFRLATSLHTGPTGLFAVTSKEISKESDKKNQREVVLSETQAGFCLPISPRITPTAVSSPNRMFYSSRRKSPYSENLEIPKAWTDEEFVQTSKRLEKE